MANECTLIFETEVAIPFTCANGTGIEKGTVLKLEDPLTVSYANASNQIVGGIAKNEKIASDGKTKISIYRGGIFKGTCSGSVTIGCPLCTAETNKIRTGLGISGVNIIGIALEAGSNGETILFELKPLGVSGVL